jgi:hypothetical protein
MIFTIFEKMPNLHPFQGNVCSKSFVMLPPLKPAFQKTGISIPVTAFTPS